MQHSDYSLEFSNPEFVLPSREHLVVSGDILGVLVEYRGQECCYLSYNTGDESGVKITQRKCLQKQV